MLKYKLNRCPVSLINRIIKPLKIYLVFILFIASVPLAHASDQLRKHLLIAHPTQGTIEAIYALHINKLVDFSAIQLTGIYHQNESYDYSKSLSILDTISSLKIELRVITDTLVQDSLFCSNACTQEFTNLFENSDGIIFFGGPDIPPVLYGEKTHPKTKVTDPYRHYFEASFLFHLLGGYQAPDYIPLLEQNPEYFILGICLGMQTMNVATGGTLIQDIPSEIYHSEEKKGLNHLNTDDVHRNYAPFSSDKSMEGSWFHKIQFKDYYFIDLIDIKTSFTPLVNSYHHQAIEKLGKGFKVGATSMDMKIIEGIFHVHYPNVIGVQFHPERSQFYLKSKNYQFFPNKDKRTLDKWFDSESMEFHIQFWKAVDKILNEKL